MQKQPSKENFPHALDIICAISQIVAFLCIVIIGVKSASGFPPLLVMGYGYEEFTWMVLSGMILVASAIVSVISVATNTGTYRKRSLAYLMITFAFLIVYVAAVIIMMAQ